MKKQTRRRFEYQYLSFHGLCVNSPQTKKSLDKLGAEGWQLVSELKDSVMGYPSRVAFSGLFMREKP